MPRGLRRYQQCGDLHFLTFSCHHRLPHLRDHAAAELFESALEQVRRRYGIAVLGYVVMPEHVHLLVSEPGVGCPMSGSPQTGPRVWGEVSPAVGDVGKHRSLDRVIQALKISVARRRAERPFWQRRYYDFNVHTAGKTTEKLRYIHRNPVVRGLVERPEDWPWSSYRHYATGLRGTVEIESFWTAWQREQAKGSSDGEHVR